MTASLRNDAKEEPQAPLQKAPQRDVYDIVLRMVLGLVMNYVTRRLRKRGEAGRARKEAQRRISKLQKKGKDVPAGLAEDAVEGLSRRKRKKAISALKPARGKGKKKKKKKGRKLALLVIVVAAVAFAVRAAGKKP